MYYYISVHPKRCTSRTHAYMMLRIYGFSVSASWRRGGGGNLVRVGVSLIRCVHSSANVYSRINDAQHKDLYKKFENFLCMRMCVRETKKKHNGKYSKYNPCDEQFFLFVNFYMVSFVRRRRRPCNIPELSYGLWTISFVLYTQIWFELIASFKFFFSSFFLLSKIKWKIIRECQETR